MDPGHWASIVNQISVDTRWGLRRFELYNGDLTRLPVSERADVLTLSVMPGTYEPRPGSMIGALHERFGLRLDELLARATIDARSAFGCWISDELPEAVPYRRVIVDETLGLDGRNVADVLGNIFAFGTALEAKRIPLKQVVMPLMGAGVQRIDPADIVDPLLTTSLDFFERSRTVERLRFVELDTGRADRLSKAMDKHLGRRAVGVDDSRPGVSQACRDIVLLCERHAEAVGDHASVLRELAGVARDPKAVSTQVFGAARRLSEAVVADLHARAGARRDGVLLNQIEALSALGFSPWVASYLHLLRVQGNSTVHHQAGGRERRPAHLSTLDLEVGLHVIHRVLKLWLEELSEA